MSKKNRMGKDPLAFIQDSRDESKPSTQSLQSIQSKQEETPSTEKGLKDGWTRATYIVRKDHKQALKNVAYWERKDLKDVIDEALAEYLEKREDTLKKIKEFEAEFSG